MKNQYSNRRLVIGGIIIVVALIFSMQLFNLQVIDPSFRSSADNNSTRYVTQFPGRGLIFDRTGKELLVFNAAAFDLQIIPKQAKPFDTIKLCKILEIPKDDLIKEIKKAKAYSIYKPSTIVKQISAKKYAILQELLYEYKGFSIQKRTLRQYPKKIASHVLGYVGEVDDKIIENDPYYNTGDYIGATGIEKAYEKELRGKKGEKVYLVDVHNRIQGSFKNGNIDIPEFAGADIISTIDAKLQEYGELLMQNKKGSIVAIEPLTGEILAFVSSPGYDPNLLVGQVRSHNFKLLAIDSLTPLFNRASMAMYPPGSTFKLMNALIGLQENVISTSTAFTCANGYNVGSFHLGCLHSGTFALIQAIQVSCNGYFCNVFRRIIDNNNYPTARDGYIQWKKAVNSFGIGKYLNTDLTSELKGIIPSPEYFDAKYGGKKRWTSLMLVSMAIGQGEVGVTPLQLSNFAGTIANKGFYYIPHLVKEIQGSKIDVRFIEKHYTIIDSANFRPIIDGMELVVLSGTATSANIEGLKVCGKTGTAQNPHGDEHSLFMGFAPKENPKIAIAVCVENAGQGYFWAAPIAGLMIQKYISGSIPDTYPSSYWQEKILKADMIRGLNLVDK